MSAFVAKIDYCNQFVSSFFQMFCQSMKQSLLHKFIKNLKVAQDCARIQEKIPQHVLIYQDSAFHFQAYVD